MFHQQPLHQHLLHLRLHLKSSNQTSQRTKCILLSWIHPEHRRKYKAFRQVDESNEKPYHLKIFCSLGPFVVMTEKLNKTLNALMFHLLSSNVTSLDTSCFSSGRGFSDLYEFRC